MKIGNAEWTKQPSMIEEKAYRDTWGGGISSYLEMMHERLVLMRELLAENGSIYVHLDWHVGHYVKVMMDEIFGYENFRNEVEWFYKTGGVPEKTGFSRKHDILLMYSKSNNFIFNLIKEKSYLMHKYGFSNIEIKKDERGYYTEIYCRDVWDIPALQGNQPEKLEYATQKPEALLERIIKASSNEGDLVADFFCGSGTTLAVAEKLGRRWIGADLSKFAIHTTRKRLLDIPHCRPFEILNLGKYERQYWQKEEVGDKYLEFIVNYPCLKAGRLPYFVGFTLASPLRHSVIGI